jgi:hypothetical protein
MNKLYNPVKIEHCDKTIIADGHKLKDFFTEVKPYISESGFHGGIDRDGNKYKYSSDIPHDKRQLFLWLKAKKFKEKVSLQLIPTEEFSLLLNENMLIEERNFISFELIEWDDCFILIAENSLILGNCWISRIKKQEVEYFLKGFIE